MPSLAPAVPDEGGIAAWILDLASGGLRRPRDAGAALPVDQRDRA